MTLIELATFLLESKRKDLAIEVLNVFKENSINLQQYDQVAAAFDKIQDYPSVIEIANKQLQLATPEQEYTLRENLTRLYNILNEPNLSLEQINWILQRTPDNINVLIEKSISLTLLNKKEESNDLLLTLLEQDHPKDIIDTIEHNLTNYYLSKGEFRQGIVRTIKKERIWENVNQYGYSYWTGGKFEGTLLIEGSGGYGDELINLRFMQHIKELGMIPVWKSHRKDIRSIVKRNGFEAIEHISELHTDNVMWVHGMRLPVYLDITEKDLWKGSYIQPTQESIDKFKRYKGCVGIRYFGEKSYEHNLHRTIPLEEVVQVIPQDKQLVSCHLESISSSTRNIIDLSSELNDYDDTLGLLWNLDYVVTSCTSVAHAAAAMGKKVYIFVPIMEYYIWASTKGLDTVWYRDNVKLLRQQTLHSWKEPIEQLALLLKEENEN